MACSFHVNLLTLRALRAPARAGYVPEREPCLVIQAPGHDPKRSMTCLFHVNLLRQKALRAPARASYVAERASCLAIQAASHDP